MKKTRKTETREFKEKNVTAEIQEKIILNKSAALMLSEAEETALKKLRDATDAVGALSRIRLNCKLSNARVAGVYRELKELIKVLSVYR